MRPGQPLIGLDVSQSWLRGTGDSAWRRAAIRARALAGDSVLLIGETVRAGAPPALPGDTAAHLLEAVEQAQLAGRPLVVLSDGESDVEMDVLAQRLAAGSRLEVHPPARGADAAISGFSVPAAALAGDTIVATVTLVAGERAPTNPSLVLRVDDSAKASRAVSPLGPWETRAERLVFVLPPGPIAARVLVILRGAGDAEPRNDTASRLIRRGQRWTAVAISTAPDFDFRSISGVLRSALSLRTNVRFRVAPERWVDDAGRAVAEREVRAEMERAPLVVLHGDTAYFGAPRATARGALALIPRATDDTEWYVTAAPGSPLSFLLSRLPFDSLPPVALGAVPADAVALLNARGPTGRLRAAASGVDGVRRVAIVPMSGTGRWAMRGGAAGEAFRTFWVGLFEWLAEQPGEELAVPPPQLPARELLPQRPRLRTASLGSRASPPDRAPLRSHSWPYLLLVALLCGEWLLRRRAGLR